jgi:hypothetical protein
VPQDHKVMPDHQEEQLARKVQLVLRVQPVQLD